MRLLWLDDVRDPSENDWIVFCPFPKNQISEIDWVKNYSEFCKNIEVYGLPDGICFDNSLGDIDNDGNEKTGYDCAKWLVEYCINNNLPLPLWNCQSSEPHSRDLINAYLNNYKKSYEN